MFGIKCLKWTDSINKQMRYMLEFMAGTHWACHCYLIASIGVHSIEISLCQQYITSFLAITFRNCQNRPTRLVSAQLGLALKLNFISHSL